MNTGSIKSLMTITGLSLVKWPFSLKRYLDHVCGTVWLCVCLANKYCANLQDALAFSTNVVPRTRQSVTPQTSVDIPNAAEDKAASRKASIGTSSASRAEPAVVSSKYLL